ncbi:hypothetical protein DRH29_02585 [candidate division Kazan bacterium]|uniref:TraC-like domain-containing protein n=1 Tax=candidate division Kazan bacterium TaxID=2202143 RepID=A0A420ZD02_UNCK3|nr:MAG: hypothetical protein DRH29_02585 [candidate division Kazan bacterium]
MAKKKKPTSTQKYLPIKEIRESIVILKDGGYRTVLMVNAINFNLKSRDEQEALLNNYQSFLNGLSFPIQILVQSRTLDLDAYLKTLNNAINQQSNDLMRTQTQDYTNFVRELIGVANIMSKTFYVIIPYNKPIISGGLFGKLFGKKPVVKGKKFENIKGELNERTGLVASGLSGLGLSAVQLNTQELIELLYFTYNPDTARRQKLFSVSNVDVSVIQNIKEAE